MSLLKRFRKIGQAKWGKWITQKVNAVRKPFPIPLEEPLTREMLDYLIDKNGLLFPSPYTDRTLTRIWAYQLIRRISNALPRSLFKRLGLDRPQLDEAGNIINNEIHLWLHWARSQRASQLSAEYDFKEADLMEWFGWLDYKTALHYSHLGYEKLASKMLFQIDKSLKPKGSLLTKYRLRCF